MKIFYRDCIKDFVLEAVNGDKLELVKGREYITSPIEDGMVTVFTKYWVKVPADLFEGEREKPKESLYEKPPLGLKPKSIADEERHDEVCQAIMRYMTSKKPIPDEWLKEYQGWFKGERVMNPTNKMRWITRTVQVPTYGHPSTLYGSFTGIVSPPVTPSERFCNTMQVPILQQWWSGINNNGDAIGEWRDVPVEVE